MEVRSLKALTNIEKQEVVDLYQQDVLDNLQIAEKYRIAPSSVVWAVKKKGFKSKRQQRNQHYLLLKDKHNLIIDEYKSGKTLNEIGVIFDAPYYVISEILHRNGFRPTPNNCYRVDYQLNHNYFNKIDSPEKAYWLGLLYADGCVCNKSNRIYLVSNDLYLINGFKNAVGCTKEIYRNPNHKNAYTYYFSSIEMKRDLIKLGCWPQKSLTLKFPAEEQVPSLYLWDFLRGEFDGDGSVNYSVSIEMLQAYFLGTKDFCEGVLVNLIQNQIKSNKLQQNGKIFRIRITGEKNLKKLYQKLYNNPVLALPRKKVLFERYL